jgi:hypothetical protein
VIDAAGAIYVIGGFDTTTGYLNDVWQSTDGGTRPDFDKGVAGGTGLVLGGYYRGTTGYYGGTGGVKRDPGGTEGLLEGTQEVLERVHGRGLWSARGVQEEREGARGGLGVLLGVL